MDEAMEKLVEECEATWPTTKELAFVIDDPLEKLMEKAQKIFKGRHWENLDALAVRIADACPGEVTEKNFAVAEPIAGAARKYFSNVEKLRTGLNRPFLDAKKAVDEAAKATVARAEPTLNPIIKAVKAIEDRKKREKEAKEEADRKKIEDDRLAAEKAHRDMIEAEHAAEKKRLADQAAENRREADALAAKNRAANDELADLRRQMAEMWRTEAKPEVPKFGAGMGPGRHPFVQALDKTLGAKIVQMDDHGYPILPKAPDFDAPLDLPAFDDPPLVQEPANNDQYIVRQFGDAVAAFKDRVGRPACVSQAARQAVELAVFDLCEIAKRLQEWRAA